MLVGVESQCGHLLCPHQKHRLSWSGWRRWGLAYRWRKHILRRNWSQGTQLSTATQSQKNTRRPLRRDPAANLKRRLNRRRLWYGEHWLWTVVPVTAKQKGNAATYSNHGWMNGDLLRNVRRNTCRKAGESDWFHDVPEIWCLLMFPGWNLKGKTCTKTTI